VLFRQWLLLAILLYCWIFGMLVYCYYSAGASQWYVWMCNWRTWQYSRQVSCSLLHCFHIYLWLNPKIKLHYSNDLLAVFYESTPVNAYAFLHPFSGESGLVGWLIFLSVCSEKILKITWTGFTGCLPFLSPVPNKWRQNTGEILYVLMMVKIK